MSMEPLRELSEETLTVDATALLPDGETIEFVEVIDIELFVREHPHHHKPRARHYRIKIDKMYYTVDAPHMTGSQLLELAGKIPVTKYMLSQKLHGGAVHPVKLDETIDFRAPGVERFMTLPLDQTEG